MPFKDSRFVFLIPLKGRLLSRNWDNVVAKLRETVRSLMAQSEPAFRVVIACQDEPDIGVRGDARFEWLRTDVEQDPTAYHGDKRAKILAMGTMLRKAGGDDFYGMLLDGDDLVHKDMVKHVLAGDNRNGYVLYTGYIYDYQSARMNIVQPPSRQFYHICGSSCAAYYTADDLKRAPDAKASYFALVTQQSYVEIVSNERGRTLEPLPFPAMVYRMNHDESIQFKKRGLKRQGGFPMDAEAAADMLERDFAWPEGAALARAAPPLPVSERRKRRGPP
jgi:hypothetical protein